MKRKSVLWLYLASITLLIIALSIQWFASDKGIDTTIPIAILILIGTRIAVKRYKNK